MHAATLGHAGFGVLIAGPGGAGKSGTTLAGLASGLSTVGDDYILLDQEGAPTALPLYRYLKQDPAGITRIPGLAERLCGARLNWQGKYEFDPETIFPGCLVDRLSLRAILLPSIAGGRHSRLERVSRSEAVQLLARDATQQLPMGGPESVLFFGGLTASLPVYRLYLSLHPAEIAAVVAQTIETAGTPRE